MAINLQDEILSLADVSRALPAIEGKRLHVSTILRWCRIGCGGVQLEHVKIGCRVCTSRKALARFIKRRTAAGMQFVEQNPRSPGGALKPRTRKQRDRGHAEAEAELAAAEI